jgi:hypothetical protein
LGKKKVSGRPDTFYFSTKNEIWSAKVADLLHQAVRFGIVTGSVARESLIKFL